MLIIRKEQMDVFKGKGLGEEVALAVSEEADSAPAAGSQLIVRKAQLEALEQVTVKGFENRVFDHLKRFFPRHCEASGEASIRQLIRKGIGQAERYGLTSQQDACLYISLMIMLGSGFDADPQLPWATAILKEKSATRSGAMVTTLYAKAMGYIDRVEGENSERLERVLRTMFRHPLHDAWQPSTGDFEKDVVVLLLRTWLEKCEDMDENAMHRLVESGVATANRYGIMSERGKAVYIGLMLLLGSAFDGDPQFPWAQPILNGSSTSDKPERVKKLYERAVEHLKRLVPGAASAGG